MRNSRVQIQSIRKPLAATASIFGVRRSVRQLRTYFKFLLVPKRRKPIRKRS
jgi:hypothetical protein